LNFQKIFVLGAGAIGSSLSAFLSGKNNVTLIGNKAHVDAVNSNRLILEGDFAGRFSVKAETTIKEIPSNSLILLTTKAYDLTRGVVGLNRFIKDDTVIVVLQNGIQIKELVQEAVKNKIQVVRCLILMAAEFFEPGKIRLWNGEIVVERSEIGEKIAELFHDSELKTRISEDILFEEWNKLVVNCVINPLTAILRVRDNEIAVDSLNEIRHRIVEECVQVGKAEGISFKPNLEREIDRKILSYTNYSSMYQDIFKRKKTEIDFINGIIVKLGKKHGIPTYANETMVGLIKFMETQK
jgi:2-dehydropantoate 2-reductase